MSIVISDAIQQAQQAIEGGDYRSAIKTCNQLVNQFPDYAAAYRVLGEAYLEQGQTADAEQAFGQALLRDPRQPWAYHGLGLIAEEQNVLDNALAFCQVAWELAPNFPQLRDPVIRIAARRFGADGQAQLTGAALAQIYANTARLQRAAVEYRDALAELPERVDLKLGLAETLWLLNRDDDAANLCREVLAENPVTIQALVILADIEGRSGNNTDATSLRARVRAIDPDGAITATMLARNSHADKDALLLAADAIPIVDEGASAVVAERPHIAPAPDFGYQPARAEQPAQDIEDLQPLSAEEFGSEDAALLDNEDLQPVTAEELDSEDVVLESAMLDPDTGDVQPVAVWEFETALDDASEMTMADLDTAEPEQEDTAAAQSVDDTAPSIYRTDVDDAVFGLQQEPVDPAAVSEVETGEIGSDTEDDFAALSAEFGDVEPMGIEEFGAEPADIERLAAAEQDLLVETDDDLFGDLLSPFPQEGTAADHISNLTSALEDDVAGVIGRAGEQPVEVPAEDLQPETETSVADASSGTGYTTVLRELGDEGLTPFDPMSRRDMPEQPAASHDVSAGQPADIDDAARLTEDWDSIDDEIARAVPITTGHTDRLRAADDLGIAPFDFEVEDDTSRLPAYRPFGEDDSEITTDATAASVDEPLAVEQQPESEAASTEQSDEDVLETLQPFSMEEFDDEPGEDQPFAFSSLPWESNRGGTAVPSDEDFEALLSADDMPAAEEAPSAAPAAPASQSETDIDWTTAFQDDPQPEVDVTPAPFETPSSWEQPADWDTSLAVTRHIGGEQEESDERMAAVEAAAAESLATRDAEDAVRTPSPTTGLFSNVDPEKLVADESLFDRVRIAKTDLISQGAIAGDRPLVEEEPVVEPEPEPVVENEPDPVSWFEGSVADTATEEDFVVSTGASRDINTLRASLQAAPNDDELHWWLAEALRVNGDVDESYGEYRWLVRNAAHRADDVIAALNLCIEQEQHAEMGHRLLADIYRRRGAVSLASSHAATAMAVRRRLRG